MLTDLLGFPKNQPRLAHVQCLSNIDICLFILNNTHYWNWYSDLFWICYWMTWSFMIRECFICCRFLFVFIINGWQSAGQLRQEGALIDKFGTEAAMFKGRVVMIPIWNPAPIISNINNHQEDFVIITSNQQIPRQKDWNWSWTFWRYF